MRFRTWLGVLALALGALLIVCAVSQPSRAAGLWYVAPGGDDVLNDCLSAGAPCATINGAIGKATAGDTVYVATGTYTEASGDVVQIDKDITLSGGWNVTFAVQSGTSIADGGGHALGLNVTTGVIALIERVAFENGGARNMGTLTLDDSAVRGGGAPNGGGIRNDGILVLNRCAVSGNSASTGGGIYNTGTLTLNASTISGNTVDSTGGGIFNTGAAATVYVNGSSVSDNSGYGGGIRNDGGTVIVDDSDIVGNGASHASGRGIVNSGAMTVTNSTIRGNLGGGIVNQGRLYLTRSTVSDNVGSGISTQSSLTVDNSTISGNAADEGGGVLVWPSGTMSVVLNNATISGNAADRGGGLYVDGGSPYATVTLQNTILAGNLAGTAPDCLGSIVSLGHNLIGSTSECYFTPGAGDVTGADAKLGELVGPPGAPRYHPLLLGSPAIDGGDPAGCMGGDGLLTTDQRGAGRVGRCDIGAYEYTAPGAAAFVSAFGGTPQRAPPSVTFYWPLQAAVLDGAGSPVGGATVSFVGPVSGVGGTFADSGAHTTTALTDEAGIASAAVFTANALTGTYTVTVTVGGVVTPVHFSLANFGWYVAPSGDDMHTCQTAATPCATIHGVLAKPDFVAGDTALVATGIYTGTGEQVVKIDRDVILSGGWDVAFAMQNGASTIDGESSRRGVVVNSGVTAAIERFMVQNGSTGIDNQGLLFVNGSTIRGQSDSGIGNAGTMTVNSSAVIGNRTDYWGGGIFNSYSGILTLNNSTVSKNNGGSGGGIFSQGTLAVNNSTISGNTASDSGGGIARYTHSGIVILQNTILADNTASSGPDCSGTVDSLGYNLVEDASGCSLNQAAGDLLNADAKLGPLEGSPGSHHLLYGSPALDGGNPAGCADSLGNPLLTDQRGLPRVGRCDIGAVEAQALETSSKVADASFVAPGMDVGYTIALRNIGDTAISGIILTDTLPISVTYTPASLDVAVGSYGYADGVITWTGSIGGNGLVTIRYRGTLSSTVQGGATVVNPVAISGDGATITRTATVIVDVEICDLVKDSGNPVLSVGLSGSWDSDSVWNPVVLKERDGYKMWYTGSDGTNPTAIGLAISTDGVHWVKHAGNPVMTPEIHGSWKGQGIRAGTVISDSGRYRMWYTGYDRDWVARIRYAESSDGVTWIPYGSYDVDIGVLGGWEDSGVRDPAVVKSGGLYQMWYVGHDGLTSRIGHAVSTDGRHWLKDTANPVLDAEPSGDWDWLDVYAPSVVAYDDAYLFLYSGDTMPPAWQTGYALSTDGIAWARKGVILPEGPDGAFDDSSADYASVIADGAGLRIWYSGYDGNQYNIGYATAEMCGVSTDPGHTVYMPIVMRSFDSQYPCPAYYADSFGNPSSGWPVSDSSSRRYAYVDGQYQIWVKEPYSGWLITPGVKAADFAVAVSVRRTSGVYGAYGVIFGLNEDWREYYLVIIDSNYYRIRRYLDGRGTTLVDWTQAPHLINTGTLWNRLKVVRDGATIALYVNNHHLTTIVDASFTGLRRIGLAAFSPSTSLDVRFDDFRLYPASCGLGAAGVGFGMGVPEVWQAPEATGIDLQPAVGRRFLISTHRR
jgi:uncharacterized repeat protein (TIGR01451 family)